MAKPLTWNMAGLCWNQPGATWNGTAAASTKMNKVKAIINFSDYADGDLPPAAQTIHDEMTTNAATFPSPPVTMTALQTMITTYTTALTEKTSHATSDMVAFKAAREALVTGLASLGNYVNSVAKGDLTIVEQSGFPYYSTTHVADDAQPDAPANLRLRHGKVSGVIEALYKPDREGSMNEVQKCTGDPAVEANWAQVGIFNGSKASIEGLTPGGLVTIRVRTCGRKGVMGAWSDIAQIRVL